MKLVDTLDEQAALEDLLDASKPPLPPECEGLHYLLSSPFRYAPVNPNGSRFRRPHQREGTFYAAEQVTTAAAETAFYGVLFHAESKGDTLPANPTEHTAFSTAVSTDRLLDLTMAPLDKDEMLWTDLTQYGPCQDFADAARQGKAEALRYMSVRDPQRGANVALLEPRAFQSTRPDALQTWRFFVRHESVQAVCEMPPYSIEYRLDDPQGWAKDPRIAAFSARQKPGSL